MRLPAVKGAVFSGKCCRYIEAMSAYSCRMPILVCLLLGAYIHGVLTFNGCLLSRFYGICAAKSEYKVRRVTWLQWKAWYSPLASVGLHVILDTLLLSYSVEK